MKIVRAAFIAEFSGENYGKIVVLGNFHLPLFNILVSS
jgi:hypothetical protein